VTCVDKVNTAQHLSTRTAAPKSCSHLGTIRKRTCGIPVAHDGRRTQTDFAGDNNDSQEIVRACEQPSKEAMASSPPVMNEERQQIQPSTGNTIASTSVQLTVNEAAYTIGVDSFTILGLIQRGKLNPARSPSGEIMVPKGELIRLLEKGR